MLHRSKTKDRATGLPGPVFMTSKQMEEYLTDLRTPRIARPTGARPPPSSFHSARKSISSTVINADPAVSSAKDMEPDSLETPLDPPSRSTSAQSFHRKTSSSPLPSPHIGRPLVRKPVDTGAEETTDMPYMESGNRWRERQEARSLRMALQDMDLEEEQKLHCAAQEEASDLVWKHQNPNAPYKYSEHLRKGSYAKAQEVQRKITKTRKRDSSSSRSVSGSSSGSSRIPSDSSLKVSDSPVAEQVSEEESAEGPKIRRRSVQFVPLVQERVVDLKEPVQGQPVLMKEKQVTDQPKSSVVPIAANMASSVVPAHFRNPFSRVRSKQASISRPSSCPPQETKRHEKVEIYKNPPSQSRDAGYTRNPAVPSPLTAPTTETVEDVKMKDGKEIRSDDIRKATSMSLKDRSPKLPTPSMVSDNPGRPIVSFNSDWKPKEMQLKEEVSVVSIPVPQPKQPLSSPAIPTISVSGPDRRGQSVLPNIPVINFPDEAPSPSSRDTSRPRVPLISVNSAPATTMAPPSISVTPSNNSTRPTRSAPLPVISVNGVPSISITSDSGPNTSARPLPTPGSSRPGPRKSATAPVSTKTSHWTPSARRSSALCSHCALPISGRIVTAAGVRFHPECFRCYHCSEALECVAFYPEPDTKRCERVARIQARMNGEEVEEQEGCTEEYDGDESLRFYCHLDFHEFFSPRCKSCKTPIEGEVIVACGAEWHSGHFFCAQCGDPFDATTPFVEKDGYAWCVNCHTNRFSTKCKKCRKPVTDTVVKALGAEWHEQCFCCTECKGPFSDGRYFLRPGGDEPFCPACEEKRLKA